MKKNFFLYDDINQICVRQLVSEICIFYFGYLSSGHPVYVYQSLRRKKYFYKETREKRK
jgi:hypothetical protein